MYFQSPIKLGLVENITFNTFLTFIKASPLSDVIKQNVCKVMTCFMFILSNETFIRYAVEYKNDRTIYKFAGDKEKGVLRDFEGTAFHLNSYDNAEHAWTSLKRVITALKYVIEHTGQKNEWERLASQFNFEGEIGCLEARIGNVLNFSDSFNFIETMSTILKAPENNHILEKQTNEFLMFDLFHKAFFKYLGIPFDYNGQHYILSYDVLDKLLVEILSYEEKNSPSYQIRAGEYFKYTTPRCTFSFLKKSIIFYFASQQDAIHFCNYFMFELSIITKKSKHYIVTLTGKSYGIFMSFMKISKLKIEDNINPDTLNKIISSIHWLGFNNLILMIATGSSNEITSLFEKLKLFSLSNLVNHLFKSEKNTHCDVFSQLPHIAAKWLDYKNFQLFMSFIDDETLFNHIKKEMEVTDREKTSETFFALIATHQPTLLERILTIINKKTNFFHNPFNSLLEMQYKELIRYCSPMQIKKYISNNVYSLHGIRYGKELLLPLFSTWQPIESWYSMAAWVLYNNIGVEVLITHHFYANIVRGIFSEDDACAETILDILNAKELPIDSDYFYSTTTLPLIHMKFFASRNKKIGLDIAIRYFYMTGIIPKNLRVIRYLLENLFFEYSLNSTTSAKLINPFFEAMASTYPLEYLKIIASFLNSLLTSRTSLVPHLLRQSKDCTIDSNNISKIINWCSRLGTKPGQTLHEICSDLRITNTEIKNVLPVFDNRYADEFFNQLKIERNLTTPFYKQISEGNALVKIHSGYMDSEKNEAWQDFLLSLMDNKHRPSLRVPIDKQTPELKKYIAATGEIIDYTPHIKKNKNRDDPSHAGTKKTSTTLLSSSFQTPVAYYGEH